MQDQMTNNALSVVRKHPVLTIIAATYIMSLAIVLYMIKISMFADILYLTLLMPLIVALGMFPATITVILFAVTLYLYSMKHESHVRLKYASYISIIMYWLFLVFLSTILAKYPRAYV